MQQDFIINRQSSIFNLQSSVICPPPSTSVEKPLQINLFMQSKPNFRKSQMNVSILLQMDYENKRNWTIGQSKPNSNPIKPNLRKAKMNVNLTLTKDYRKNDDFVVRINKPNLVRRRRIAKMNVNLYILKDYENETAFRLQKNKPNSNPISAESLLNLSINFADNTSCSLVTPCLISGTGYSYLGRRKMPLKRRWNGKRTI